MLGDMKRVQTSHDIDLTDWTFIDDDTSIVANIIFKGFAAEATKTLRAVFDEDPPNLSFPFQWSHSDGRYGPRPDDPVTLYLDLPLGPYGESRVTYCCSLETVVDDLIEFHTGPSRNRVGNGDDRETCGRVATRLRELAAKLDAVCSPESVGQNDNAQKESQT